MAAKAAKRAVLGAAEVQPLAADLALTGLRVFTGLAMAIAHGWGKLPPSEGFITHAVGGMGLPAPAFFAWAAGLSEFVGGLLLALGLLTRPAAFFVLVTMLGAGFVLHAGDPFGDRELALLFAASAFAFLFVGSGRFGLDRFLR